MDLVAELFVAALMVLVTVAIQGVGLLALGRLLRRLLDRIARMHGRSPINPLTQRGAIAAGATAMGLLCIHGVQIWTYALFYVAVGAIGGLRDAIYFSTISFAAIGYGDVRVTEEWKLLGAIEGINGALLLGWSVAFFVAELTRHNMHPHGPGHHSDDGGDPAGSGPSESPVRGQRRRQTVTRP